MPSTVRSRLVRISATDEQVGEPAAVDTAQQPAPAPVSAVAPSSALDGLPAPAAAPTPPATPPPTQSIALPFMKRPEMLDGTLAGDFGFDPLGIANSAERLSFMADSEIKHARLAMLCAAGWPLAELWHNGLASAVGLEPQLAPGGRAPSVLNGALLDRPTGLAGLALLIGVGVAIELSTFALGFGEAQKKQDAYNAKLPGELGFDPLGLVRGYGESEQAQKAMRTAELKNGRTAMVAVLMYVIEEVTTGKPVTQLTPFIFKPFWQIVVEAMGASPMGGDGYDAYLRASEADDAAAAVAEPAAAAAEPAAAVAEPAAAAAAVAPIAATMTDAAAAVAPVADAVPAPVADAAAAAATDALAPIAAAAADIAGAAAEAAPAAAAAVENLAF